MAAVPAEILLHLLTDKGDVFEIGIYSIDEQNDFKWRVGLDLGSTGCMEAENLHGLVVVQQGKVLEFESGYSLSRLVCYHDVELDAALRLIGLPAPDVGRALGPDSPARTLVEAAQRIPLERRSAGQMQGAESKKESRENSGLTSSCHASLQVLPGLRSG